MDIYFDTEFIEGPATIKSGAITDISQPLPASTTVIRSIQLVSIGLVAADNREYYAVSTDFNPADASPWVRKNVLSLLPPPEVDGKPNALYKSNRQIAQDVIAFVYPNGLPSQDSLATTELPRFIAYYADYDWVVFCWLFGSMINLPAGFPMYCYDLKQEADRLKVTSTMKQLACPDPTGEHDALVDARWNQRYHKYLQQLAEIKQ